MVGTYPQRNPYASVCNPVLKGRYFKIPHVEGDLRVVESLMHHSSSRDRTRIATLLVRDDFLQDSSVVFPRSIVKIVWIHILQAITKTKYLASVGDVIVAFSDPWREERCA